MADRLKLRNLALAGPVLLLASCANEYSTTSHDGGTREDDSRFTLNWAHSCKAKETEEFLALRIPYGPIGVPVDIDGTKVQVEFGHAVGRDYYDPPPGAKERKECDQVHTVQGTVVILSQELGRTRAALRVTANCPVNGRYEIKGEYSFESVSVFYR